MLDKLEKEYALPIVKHFSYIGKALISLLVEKYGDYMSRSCLLGVTDNTLTVEEFDTEIFGKLSYFLSYIRFYNDAGSWKFALFFNKKLLTISAKSFLTLVIDVKKRIKNVEILNAYEDTKFAHMSILPGKEKQIIHQDVYMTTYMLFRTFFDKEFKDIEVVDCNIKGRGVYKIDQWFDLELIKYSKDNRHIIFDFWGFPYLNSTLNYSGNKAIGFYVSEGIGPIVDFITEHVEDNKRKNIFICVRDNVDPVQKLCDKEYARKNGIRLLTDYNTYKVRLNYYAYKKD